MTDQISFNDGAAYERYMGIWSRHVGNAFLEWLAPGPGRRWLDVGCGNGAFTRLIVERAEPVSVAGIDPSEAQLEYALARGTAGVTEFRKADAMDLPFPADVFDAAVMPLVIFFVPDPAKGVSEMVRVTRPGGLVSAYSWDMDRGGFPYATLHDELNEMGFQVLKAPSPEASRLEVMEELWMNAGLESIRQREIVVERTFESFDDYWSTVLGGPSVGRQLSALSRDETAALKDRLRARLAVVDGSTLTLTARANAIVGRVRE